MVLYKRKPVTYLPPPPNLQDNTEVWEIKATGEVFTDYEKYLKRFDYLSQNRFTDGVNGKSGLSFFAALTSEAQSSNTIETIFPEVLRDPILRKVQFSTISRIDDLVSAIYEEFKHDFFPGEEVHAHMDDGEQFEGVIREKAKFPMIRGSDGSVQREAFSRYFLRLNNQLKEALMDDKHIRRDRKVFTKQNLRAFLKNSLQRESWTGAPWLVKEHLAIQYRLPMEIPAHLLQEARLLQHKQQMLQMKPQRGRRLKNLGPNDFQGAMTPQQIQHMQMMQQQHPSMPMASHGSHFHYQQAIVPQQMPPLAAPPVLKYPIEDLDLPPKSDNHRPVLGFLTEDLANYIKDGRQIIIEGIKMSSVGPLLEVWNTLNVQAEVFYLDSFTFDDFFDAMRFSTDDVECELLNEMHCAVLKQLVNEQGALQIHLPDMAEEEEESSGEVPEESETSTPMPDAPARITRSRLSQVNPAIENPRSPTTPADVKMHRAQDLLGGESWIERLKIRNFQHGGWQVILVGLLYQLSRNPRQKAACDKILAELTPLDVAPTDETVKQYYDTLEINLRISALQIITMLSLSTKSIRQFLEHCSEDMTDVRKKKTEFQRTKKDLVEQLMHKDRERKILLPDNMPDSPKAESPQPSDSPNGTLDDTLHTNGTIHSDPDDEEPTGGRRSLRGGADRKRKREEENARKEEEKRAKVEAAKAASKQSKEFKSILNDIEKLKAEIKRLEDEIQDCDRDLREANIQRTKVLGRDRYFNRYYWFERNGMPFGGLPTSSTVDYGYANGRVWVQGPDDIEREGFLDKTPQEAHQDQMRHGMTVPQRKEREEAPTSLLDANEWACIDDPDVLDSLIGWLDEKGKREKDLRKELLLWRDDIVTYMRALKDFTDKQALKKAEVEDESTNRISTRHKTYVNSGSAAAQRCLRWTNGAALEEFGHIHSEQPKPKEKKKKVPAAAEQRRGVAKLVLNRHGKPVTRQGDSYTFK